MIWKSPNLFPSVVVESWHLTACKLGSYMQLRIVLGISDVVMDLGD